MFDLAKPAGTQYVREASALGGVPSGYYEVLLASHVLEHLANPLGALCEWARVVLPGGFVVLVVAHRDGTFDHRRPVTSIEHLDDDLRRGTAEDDLTHLPEILALHDLRRDPAAGSTVAFRARSEQNPKYRCLHHHHVFDARLVVWDADRVGWEIVAVSVVRPYHNFLVARTPSDGTLPPDNGRWFSPGALALARSPFPSDRVAP